MDIAVLSPCVLEKGDKSERVHYAKLSALIDNLCMHTNLKFQLYQKAPFDSYKMEIPVYEDATLNNLVTVNVYGKIQKMLLKEYIDLEDIAPVQLPREFILDETPLTNAFRSYLNYLKGVNSLLFIGEHNFHVPRPVELHGDDTSFEMNASTYINIELSDILLPYLKSVDNLDSIFPRASFCSKYNQYVLDIITSRGMGEHEQQALFEDIGSIVAIYNMYSKNNRLSRINTTAKKKRIVYEKKQGKKYYLSLDLESGGYEVFDRAYRHLGQFSFSCKQVRPAEPLTHILRH